MAPPRFSSPRISQWSLITRIASNLRRFVGLLAGSLALAALALLLTSTVLRRTADVSAGLTLAIPADEPSRGLIFAGLTTASSGPCQGGYILPTSGLCTHGPNAAPEGVDINAQPAPAPASAQSVATIACEGDGTSGNRTQVGYARPSNSPNGDRYNTYLGTFRQLSASVDTIYDASAAETGGSRRIRFVTDASCDLSVLNVVLSANGASPFDKTISELQAQGYNRADRKYLVFMDASVLCGISTFYGDDRPGSENYNNRGVAGYARIDTGCWEANAVAHEHMHTLGGVQNSAPNASGGRHCVDEYDVMCYSDTPNYPTMRQLCPNSTANDRFDCGKNDYFNTNPAAGSYLATHWNTTNNDFLIKSSTPNPSHTAPSAPPSPATPSPSPSSAPQAGPVAASTARLTVQDSVGGAITPAASAVYTVGTTVTARAVPNNGYIFIGWRVDGADRGWTNPLSLTMDANHTIAATFAARPSFGDLPADNPAYEAIGQLAARGIIKGYDTTMFGPDDEVLRAQMAALIARAMGWGSEGNGNPFPDQQGGGRRTLEQCRDARCSRRRERLQRRAWRHLLRPDRASVARADD